MKTIIGILSMMLASWTVSAQWVQTNGPLGGGHVVSLIVSGEDILAATSGSGIFISTDIGTSWDQVNYDFSGIESRQFIIAGDYILVGTDRGIYRSADGGFNWIEANIGMPSHRSVSAMAVNGSNIIAGTTSGSYFVSGNYGETWLGLSLAQASPAALAVCNNYLFVGCYSGVRRSSDNGATWIEVNTGLTDLNVQTLAVIDSTLIAGTYQGTLFTSKDSGLSWTKVKMGLAEITDLTVSGSILYVVTSGALYRSDNYGATLTSINTGLPESPGVISLTANGLNLFAGLDGSGVYFSGYGGNSWRAAGGLPCTVVKSLTVSKSTIFAGTNGHGLFKSIDNGDTWLKSNQGINDWVSIEALAVHGNTLFAGTSEGLFKSTDDGQQWDQCPAGWQIISLFVNGNTIYAGAYWGGLYVSSDDGESWTQINNGLSGSVTSMAANGNTLFAGTGNGVFRSTDNANSWIPVNSGLTSTGIYSLVVSGTTLFAATYGGIFMTTNNGLLWTHVGYWDTRTMAVNGSTIFASTYSGAIISTDNGSTWRDANEGWVRHINAFAFSGTNVFAGTSGSGVFINQTLLTGMDDEIAVAEQVCIYPNPAEQSITLETSDMIPNGTLHLYNVSGQQVFQHHITDCMTTIDISSLPAGLYIVRYGNGLTSQSGRFIKE